MFSRIQIPRFSLFEIYLKSSILPPFLIPNTYTKESKTTKCCWYRGTDSVLPLNFILWSFPPFITHDLFIPPFILFPSEDVVFPSEEIVWIIVFHDMTK